MRPEQAVRIALAVLLALGLIGPWRAPAADGELARAEALYEQGKMQAATRLARLAGGAAGLTLAAKATLVEALYLAPKETRASLLEHAARDARAALTLDPNDEGAYLQLAIALGQMAEDEGPVAAHLNGYAREGRQLLLRAHELAPDDPWPDGLLGIWHLQLVRYGSAVLAAELYGASVDKGLALCRDAARRAPAALALRYGCAISLLELDPKRFGAEALASLVAIVGMPAANAAERLVQMAARRQIGALRRTGAR
jgi:hypothetical protein